MKLIIFTTLIVCISSLSYAQFNLSGYIKNLPDGENLTVNVPFVFGYFDDDNRQLVVAKDGNFDKLLPLDEEKIGYLRWGSHEVFLWMRPGADLFVELDGTNGQIAFGGTMANANRLLYELELKKAPHFFAEDKRVDVNQMQDSVIRPYMGQLAANVSKVDDSPLNTYEREFLKAELHYHFITYLDLYVRTARWPSSVWSAFILDAMQTETPKPKSPFRGPMYYSFIDTYIDFLQTRAFSNQDNPTKFAELLDSIYSVNSFDSLTAIYNQYGKTYIDWLAVKHAFDANTAERYLTKHIKEKYDNGEVSEGSHLLNALELHNQNSIYLDTLTNLKTQLMEKMSVANNDIIIPDDYRTFQQIKTFVKQFQGKVVYMDIWGTWCGPCKVEMRYLPPLKEHFNEKDIIFVYLDMDDDRNDTKWREYIQANAITGIHLRKNNQDIQPIWKELLPNDQSKHHYYPTYFIFDKNGDLVIEDIKRPSDGKELVAQLEKYLNQ